MKKFCLKTAGIILFAVMFTALITVNAYAVNNCAGTVGKPLNAEYAILQQTLHIHDYTVVSGSTPPGISIWTNYNAAKEQSYFIFDGTPTSHGNYSVTIRVYDDLSFYNGYEELTVNFNISPGAVTAPPNITKHPTGETVEEGGSAKFISRADNATEIIWRIVSPDTSVTYNSNEAPAHFPGLSATGHGTDTLTLSNIPLSINGWKAECKFIGPGGTAFSNGAIITVVKPELKAPVINSHPGSLNKTVGEAASISVSANDPNNGTLNYQWYSSKTDVNSNGTPVSGANSSTFYPPQTEGVIYYYASVWSAKDGRTSAAVNSNTASVKYSPIATPSPSTQATEAPSPSPAVVSPTVSPAEESGKDEATGAWLQGQNRLILILLVFLMLALTATLIALIANARKHRHASDTAKYATGSTKQNSWKCERCGSFNRGRFCQECGTEKPAAALQYVCDKCGWEPPDPTRPPKFCPECGDKFSEQDRVK